MPGSAGAQSYPSNVIRIVVPAVAGTPPDIISRIVANEIAAKEGWRLIVENRPGALQTIAMNEVSNRPADGYSLLTMSLPITVSNALLPTAEIRPDVDFDPVIKISKSYTVLVTTPFFAGQFSARARRDAQEQARTVQLLIGRVRNTFASHW
jgi:tripartite-type tricarboxylate transporter receptor subunit TctC